MLNLRFIRAPKSFRQDTAAYAVPEPLREAIARHGHVTLSLDRMPSLGVGLVRAEVGRPRGSRSVAKHLKGRLNIPGPKIALLHHVLAAQGTSDAVRLAEALKALPLTLGAPRPIDEAIGTACIATGRAAGQGVLRWSATTR